MISASPLALNIPKQEWWPFQREAVNAVVESSKKYKALVAPTGSGKSVIALGVGAHADGKTIILTRTKALQEQYSRDYDIPMAIGRGNFRCLIDPNDTAATAPCADGDFKCYCKDRCEYYIQRDIALQAPICVLNYSFFLYEANYTTLIHDTGLVVCDEAQNVEAALIEFGTVEFKRHELPTDEWRSWTRTEHVCEWAARVIARLDWTKMDRGSRDFRRRLHRAMAARESAYILRHDKEGIALRPLWGSSVNWALTDHADNFLFMSATLLPTMLEAAGIDDVSWHEVPSTFPPQNRPINVWPVAWLKASSKEEDYEKIAQTMDIIIAKAMPAKTMIHFASNTMQERILSLSKYAPLIRTHTTATRGRALDEFKAAPTGILASTSMMEGVDLPDDLLRCQIIPKVPFADLGDPVVAARAKDNRSWYIQDTVARVIQAAGRGVRHRGDRCSTWILDRNFQWIYRAHRDWFPVYIRNAIKFVS